MGRGKSIDKKIKDYYYFFEDFECEDKDKIDNLYSYIESIVYKYLSQNKLILETIEADLGVKNEDILNKIFEDAWYHIYENIYFLDIRYNIDRDLDDKDFDYENGTDEYKESIENRIDVILLSDYLKSKDYDKQRERNYKDRLRAAGEYVSYSYDYQIPKTCSVYTDYYSADSINRKKRFLCKEYTDIIDFFYKDKITKTDIKSKLKNYTIWDIDEKWLPVIADLYTSIQKGNNNLLQFQLIERMFKFTTFLNIYNSNQDCSEDMLIAAQPLTVFGYSECLNFFVEKYEKLKQRENEKEVAGFLFNGISYTIKMVLSKILTVVWKIKTNEEKQQFIRDIKNECLERGKNKKMLDFFAKYDYSASYKTKNTIKLMNMYFYLLFNSNFRNAPNHRRIEEEWSDFTKRIGDDNWCESLENDDEECMDEEEQYKINIATYKGNIKGFFDSLEVESEDECCKDGEDDWIELHDVDCEEVEKCYNFNFSDLLYLVTEMEYKDFFSEN